MKINKISTDQLMSAIAALGIADLAPVSFSVTQDSVSVEYYPRDVNGDPIVVGDDDSFEVTYVDIPLEELPKQAIDALVFLAGGETNLQKEPELHRKTSEDMAKHREAVGAQQAYARRMRELGLDPWTWNSDNFRDDTEGQPLPDAVLFDG